MEISRATEQDLQVIKANLIHVNGRPTDKDQPSRERMEHLMEQTLATGAYYLVLKEADETKGWVMLAAGRKDYFTQTLHGFIYELFVFAEERGKGYGKALMNAATEELQGLGMTEVRLNVFAGNPAKHLYTDLGYKPYSTVMSLTLEQNA